MYYFLRIKNNKCTEKTASHQLIFSKSKTLLILLLNLTSIPTTYEKTSPTPLNRAARIWAAAACAEKSSCKS